MRNKKHLQWPLHWIAVLGLLALLAALAASVFFIRQELQKAGEHNEANLRHTRESALIVVKILTKQIPRNSTIRNINMFIERFKYEFFLLTLDSERAHGPLKEAVENLNVQRALIERIWPEETFSAEYTALTEGLDVILGIAEEIFDEPGPDARQQLFRDSEDTVSAIEKAFAEVQFGIHDDLMLASMESRRHTQVSINNNKAMSEIFNVVSRNMLLVSVAVAGLTSALCLLFMYLLYSRLLHLARYSEAIARGDFESMLPVTAKDHTGKLALALDDMAKHLVATIKQAKEAAAMVQTAKSATEKQNWLETGQRHLNEHMRGEQSIVALAENIIGFLTPYVEAHIGLFYHARENDTGDGNFHLVLTASYAFKQRRNLASEFQWGEGVVGQAALEKNRFFVTDVREEDSLIRLESGDFGPPVILAIPFLYENTVKGVIELGFLKEPTEVRHTFIEQSMEGIAIAIASSESRARMETLLHRLSA
ncbi:MAG: GAF domain-containing protein [Gammaproteobacteria bacterium]|nr:GAF domain-containing protein [Gammaproteobacteria bacterium]